METSSEKWRQVVRSGDKCGYESGDVGDFDGWQRWRWSGVEWRGILEALQTVQVFQDKGLRGAFAKNRTWHSKCNI